jgi:hypothetical protein
MPYIEFVKPVDEAEAVKRIETRIEQNKELESLYKRIIPVLESWDGKKAGKLLQNRLIEALDGATLYANKPGQWGVSVGRNYGWMEAKFNHLLFPDWCLSNVLYYDTAHCFNFEDFKAREERMFSFDAEKENTKLFKLLERLPVMVINWNDCLKIMQSINEQAENSPVSYSPFFDMNGK